jgi:hypothetical protein
MIPKKTEKAYMFTKANSGANNPRLGMSDEKNAKSPGFLKKIAKVGK